MNTLEQALRALPVHEPPAGGWVRLQDAMSARQRRRRLRAGAGMALAASIVVTVVLRVGAPGTGLQPPAATPQAAPSELARLMLESQQLERELRQLRPQVRVWNAGLAAAARSTEQKLALVDLQLNYASSDEAATRLWQDRVALMSRLVQTHERATPESTGTPHPTELSL